MLAVLLSLLPFFRRFLVGGVGLYVGVVALWGGRRSALPTLLALLLAGGLLLCGAGAALGVISAQPLAAVLAGYASRFSVRALDFTVDSSLLWVGAALAILAAVVLAFAR